MGQFECKQFVVHQDHALMKVGTDAILLGAWVSKVSENATKILDIGTGTGIIALMMAQAYPQSKVVGVEVDELALRDARRNFDNQWKDRLHLVEDRVQDYRPSHTFDLIISNPPFFSGGTLSDNASRNAVRHTMKLSHNDLLRSVQRLISPNGHFALVLPFLEGYRFIEIARTYGLFPSQICHVQPKENDKENRLLIMFGNQQIQNPAEANLCLRNNDNSYTQSYRDLCEGYLISFSH